MELDYQVNHLYAVNRTQLYYRRIMLLLPFSNHHLGRKRQRTSTNLQARTWDPIGDVK